MSKKVSILSDYFGKSILKEMRGISFEVREWAEIIKKVVSAEMKAYNDDYNERARSQMGSYGGYHGSWKNFYDMADRHSSNNTAPITAADFATMDPDEVDYILDAVAVFHRLSDDDILNAGADKIIELYNQVPKSGRWGLMLKHREQPKPAKEVKPEADTKPEVKKPTQVIINGKDYPEAYAKFAVDQWIISEGQPTEYDHVNSGFQDSGEYAVYINCGLDNISLFVLIHEIKHAYQDWHRQSKGRPPIRKSKELQQLYTKDFEKFILSHRTDNRLRTLDSVILAYYMSSSPEITAYLEGDYDELKNINKGPEGVAKLNDFARNMSTFSAGQVETHTPPKTLQKRWVNILEEYDIPLFRKFKNVFDFLKYTERLFIKKGRYIVKKIDKLKTM